MSNIIYVVEERYTDATGKTTWSFYHACPEKHDAIAFCARRNKLWIGRQPYPEKNPPQYRVRKFKSAGIV